MDECFDLKKKIKNLNSQIENENNNLKLEYYTKIQSLEGKLNEIKYDTKDYYFDKLNYVFSDIKNSLITKGYLDFINNPNIDFINQRQKISDKLLLNLIDDDKILEFNFYETFIKIILDYENINFFRLLENLGENILFLFHINYDFIENGIMNFNLNMKDTYLFDNKIIEYDGIIDGTLIDPFNYINNRLDFIVKFENVYQEFSEKEKNYKSSLNDFLKEINNLNILAKNISLTVLIQDKEMSFLKNVDKNITDLTTAIEMFIYKNNINDNLNKRIQIIEKLNNLTSTKNILNNKIENIAKKNETYLKQNNKLKIKNYKIRELSNICINQKKNEIENEYDFHSKFHDDLTITAKKNTIKIKKINSEINIVESKKNKIIAKLNTLSTNIKDNILKKRYNSIINNFQLEIDNLNQKKQNLKKDINNGNNLLNVTIEENKIIEKSDVNIESIKEIVESTKLDKRTQQNLIQMYIEDNNIFISENKAELEVIEKKIQMENKNLYEIEKKYQELFNNYDYLVNQKEKTINARDLFRKIEYFKKDLFLNREEFMENLRNFISTYTNLVNINDNNNINDNINDNINNNFIDKLNNSILNILKLQEIIKIFSNFSPESIENKYELYYLKILSIIKNTRKIFKKNKKNKDILQDISNLNKINLKIISNNMDLKANDNLGIDLKKMIFILE